MESLFYATQGGPVPEKNEEVVEAFPPGAFFFSQPQLLRFPSPADLFVIPFRNFHPFPFPPRGMPPFFKLAGKVGKVGGRGRTLGARKLFGLDFPPPFFFRLF